MCGTCGLFAFGAVCRIPLVARNRRTGSRRRTSRASPVADDDAWTSPAIACPRRRPRPGGARSAGCRRAAFGIRPRRTRGTRIAVHILSRRTGDSLAFETVCSVSFVTRHRRTGSRRRTSRAYAVGNGNGRASFTCASA